MNLLLFYPNSLFTEPYVSVALLLCFCYVIERIPPCFESHAQSNFTDNGVMKP